MRTASIWINLSTAGVRMCGYDYKRVAPDHIMLIHQQTAMEWVSAARASTSNVTIEILSPNASINDLIKAYILSVTVKNRKFSLVLKEKELEWLSNVLIEGDSNNSLSLYKDRLLEVFFLKNVLLIISNDDLRKDPGPRKLYLDINIRCDIGRTIAHFLKTVKFPYSQYSSYDISLALKELSKQSGVSLPANAAELLSVALQRNPFSNTSLSTNEPNVSVLMQPLYELIKLLVKEQ